MGNENYDEIKDDNGNEVTPFDDDYFYWKSEWEDAHNPLSMDYQKYSDENDW